MKTKRYNGEDGSSVRDSAMYEKEPGWESREKPMSFKEAFASARKAGDKTFMFGGKKFTTELASEKKPRTTDTGDEAGRLARRYPGSSVDRIPGSSPKGWTGGKGERVTGNELTRNISNTLNATAGLSAPGFVGKETAKQFGKRAAARRAEEGLSDAEVGDLMRRRALSEADTTGGAVGYKRGGKVKKMASGGMAKSSTSKRADGIATKGKTKCKMY